MASPFQNILLGALGEAQKKREQQQKLQQLIAQTQIKQQIGQQNPINQILELGKVAEAFKSLGINIPQGGFALPGAQQPRQPRQITGGQVITGLPQAQPTRQPQGTQDFFPTGARQTLFGGLQPEGFKSREGIAIQERTKRIAEREQKIKSGQRASITNLEILTGVGRDFAKSLADATEEGGAGGAIQAFIGERATKFGDLPGFLGGKEIGGKFSRTGTVEGKRIELLLKMMPMLTQQTEKPEGSVRIIRSVLSALGETIPDKVRLDRDAVARCSKQRHDDYEGKINLWFDLISYQYLEEDQPVKKYV